jgi:CO dehydrogenase maturation factor
MREYIRAHGENKNGRRKIAVCGKGGTGKSTLTALLAGALRREGYTVLVIDSDESNPGLPRLLGLDTLAAPLISLLERFSLGDRKPDASWLEADRISLESIPRAFLVSSPRMKFLTVGKIIDPFQGCACQMADLARDFVRKIDLGTKELLLIDMEAGVESFGRGMERGVDTVLPIVEPSFDSLALAEKIRYMAEGLGIASVQAVLNKIPSPEVEEKLREELENKKMKVAGSVYLDPQISQAGFTGKKIPENTEAGAQAKQIAAALLSEQG